ncbi:cytochrome P450 monooxygenase CYP584Q1 [Cordyceps fumosorosea ARSEF 2679]|uniref:Cytochrome P450 monooxygenase CYP584Q1 n=1 Tax=Cordyceps fumosorosea (strain ARSEF 2679) TaxID=1081104 RepID=A0A167NKP0_CORFA|nr:cytochrome P450 monooxygenase CYP584Q1 [Cordyceps fumosorosea ARSEF 2679]OAA55657.1 cytochrome P450 monooxygenase CYP584Q1 [Cordyceps fumosorosea ARSEF 2679]
MKASFFLKAATAYFGAHPVLTLVLLWALALLVRRISRYRAAWRALGQAYELNGCSRPVAYPHRDPIFGLDVALTAMAAARKHRYTTDSAQRFRDLGAYTYYTWIRGRQAIHTAEPENVRCLLSTRAQDYSIAGRRAFLGRFLGRGIFVADGEDWARSRARLRPSFAREHVADLAIFERHVDSLLRVLPTDSSAVVSLQDCFLRFTFDLSSDFLVGHSTHTLTQPSPRDRKFGEAFSWSLSHVDKRMLRGPLERFYPIDPREDKERRVCRDYMGAYADAAIAARRRAKMDADKPSNDYHGRSGTEEKQRKSFLDELVEVIHDREVICDELMSTMAAGRDATASLMSNMFHELSRRPDIWQRLREDVRRALDGALPSYDQLRNLKLAQYMVNETLRLYPPVFQNGRRAERDTILPTGGGADGTAPVFVPKGTGVLFSVWTMHRRADLYGPDAETFDPDRWATPRPGWEYVPFGGGPRICLGQQFALTAATYVVVRMAQEFASVETADKAPWKERVALTLFIDDDVNCRLTRA